jgi:4'-phosphopantetheinyl transferase
VITVWRIALDPGAPPDAGAIAELSADERSRAARFATDALRNRWLHAHVAMRRILAREVGVDAASVEYGRGDHGKPFLTSPAASGLEFNLSDSEGMALLATGRAGAVGVDVERIRPVPELRALAMRYFAPAACTTLFALEEHAQLVAYFGLWARHEAALKTLGIGFDERIDRVADLTRLAVRAIEVPAGYAAALATERATPFRVIDWPA